MNTNTIERIAETVLFVASKYLPKESQEARKKRIIKEVYRGNIENLEEFAYIMGEIEKEAYENIKSLNITAENIEMQMFFDEEKAAHEGNIYLLESVYSQRDYDHTIMHGARDNKNWAHARLEWNSLEI